MDRSLLRTYFAKLQLPPEVADVYHSLSLNGPQTIAEAARSSQLERTRLYRLIPDLLESNLIELETRGKREFMKAAPLANLRVLIAAKEQAVVQLKEELDLIEQVLGANRLISPLATIQAYDGPAGQRELTKLELRASHGSEIVGVVSDPRRWDETWRVGFAAQALSARFLINQTPPPLDNVELRQLSQPLVWDFVVFDDYVVSRQPDNGLSIKSRDYAIAQRQFFELLWNQSVTSTSRQKAT